MAKAESLRREGELFFLRNKINILKIRGGSMYPILQENWSAEVSPSKDSDLRIGDIAVFDFKKELAVHRVIGRINANGKFYLLQKGDNETTPYFIEGDQVVGKVTRVFDNNNQEVLLQSWQYPRIILFILNLLSVSNSFVYYLKKNIIGSKKNTLIKFLGIVYWKSFLGALRLCSFKMSLRQIRK